jgi:hypothetical protein
LRGDLRATGESRSASGSGARHAQALDRRRHARRRAQFRRIIGYRHLAKLVIAIERHATLSATKNLHREIPEPVTV